jgi:NAD+ diphosphatase
MALQRPFTGMQLDRASTERKDPALLASLLADPSAASLLAGPDAVVLAGPDAVVLAGDGGGGGGGGELLRAAAVPRSATDAILLGLDGDRRPVFAIDLEPLSEGERARMINGGELVSLRDAGARLPHAEAGLAAYVIGLLNWHRRHRFCANCGAPTDIEEGGYSRHCPRCGANHFPRTDPVVIMTVACDRQLLLGRRTGWPPGRCSVLAGFVSPGESAEEAVVREVEEESGIVARDPVYASSQPWPFPSSLMLGFDAVSDGGEPVARDGELDEVRWYPLDAVRAALRGENPDLVLPPSISIARFLIERWVAAHDA